jgi:hypothetical protein
MLILLFKLLLDFLDEELAYERMQVEACMRFPDQTSH